jgi:CRP-like cAMP-binding protein
VVGPDVAAIVSDVPAGELRAGREELIAHAEVLARALGGSVVLPMRFGVVMDDDETVREELLVAFHDDLLAQLEQLDGKVELRLRASYDEATMLKGIVSAQPAIARRSEALRHRPAEATYYERIELGQMVAEALESKRERDTAELLESLEPLAVAVQLDEPEHERVAAHISFLVERREIPRFDDAVDKLGRRHAGRMSFKYTGPLPAYSFVELPAQR